MGFLHFLNTWWNFPFLVLLGLVIVFLILQAFGLLGHHDQAGGGQGHAGDHGGHDVHHDGHVEPGLLSEVLGFLGVGRVPLVVVWVSFFLFAGMGGLFTNRLLSIGRAHVAAWMFVVALAVALVLGVLAVAFFGRLAARVVDTGGKGSTRLEELVGKAGVVASAKLDGSFGEVRVADDSGVEILIHGRLAKDEATLEAGARVVIVDYDAERSLYWVTASPDTEGKA